MDYPYRSRVLEGLGVRPWINARNRSTLIEGTRIDERFPDEGVSIPINA